MDSDQGDRRGVKRARTVGQDPVRKVPADLLLDGCDLPEQHLRIWRQEHPQLQL